MAAPAHPRTACDVNAAVTMTGYSSHLPAAWPPTLLCQQTINYFVGLIMSGGLVRCTCWRSVRQRPSSQPATPSPLQIYCIDKYRRWTIRWTCFDFCASHQQR